MTPTPPPTSAPAEASGHPKKGDRVQVRSDSLDYNAQRWLKLHPGGAGTVWEVVDRFVFLDSGSGAIPFDAVTHAPNEHPAPWRIEMVDGRYYIHAVNGAYVGMVLDETQANRIIAAVNAHPDQPPIEASGHPRPRVWVDEDGTLCIEIIFADQRIGVCLGPEPSWYHVNREHHDHSGALPDMVATWLAVNAHPSEQSPSAPPVEPRDAAGGASDEELNRIENEVDNSCEDADVLAAGRACRRALYNLGRSHASAELERLRVELAIAGFDSVEHIIKNRHALIDINERRWIDLQREREEVERLRARVEELEAELARRHYPDTPIGQQMAIASLTRRTEKAESESARLRARVEELEGELSVVRWDRECLCKRRDELEDRIEGTGDELRKYQHKSRVYGEKAQRYRDAAIQAGAIGPDDRFDATWAGEWYERVARLESEIATLRADGERAVMETEEAQPLLTAIRTLRAKPDDPIAALEVRRVVGEMCAPERIEWGDG